jgi:hypothetical protein
MQFKLFSIALLHPFIFSGQTGTKETFKNALAVSSAPSKDLQPTLVFLQDGALTYWGKIACDYLKE